MMMELKELTDKTMQLFHVTDVADLGKALMRSGQPGNKTRRVIQKSRHLPTGKRKHGMAG